MNSLINLVCKGRKKKKKRKKLAALAGSPQRKGICAKIYTTSPKKPNSAVRKVAKVRLSSKSYVIAAIPGIGFKIIQYSNVLVRGGRVRDLPGVKYKLIRGVYDFKEAESFIRRNRRSKFGYIKEYTTEQLDTIQRQGDRGAPYKKNKNGKY